MRLPPPSSTALQEVPPTPLEGWISTKIGGVGRRLDLKALRAFQLEKINQTLALVQSRSAFYRRQLGTDQLRLSGLTELSGIPFTTAEQLRAAPFDFLCVGQDAVDRIVTLPTSGTTGAPKRVFFTADDQELTRDFFHWGMSTMVDPGDRVLILLPGRLPGSVGALLEEGLARMDVVGIPHGPVAEPSQTLQIMAEERVTALVGIPVQVLALAKTWKTMAPRPEFALKSVLLSTDCVPDSVIRIIEESWGCPVFNHYGTTEMGLGGGVDCRARTGYHLREADMLFEIVDPVSGQPMPDGSLGEVVFTTLTRRAMPLIRYRTGDMSCFVPGPCPCGTDLRRLAHVDQRVDGNLRLPGDWTLRQKDFDEALLALEGVADFQVLMSEDEAKWTLDVRVRPLPSARAPDREVLEKALRAIPPIRDQGERIRVHIEVGAMEVEAKANAGTGKRRIVFVQEYGI
jgi:phenylacetate-CoA ligase